MIVNRSRRVDVVAFNARLGTFNFTDFGLVYHSDAELEAMERADLLTRGGMSH